MSDINIKSPKQKLGLFCHGRGNFLETYSATTGHKSKLAVTFSEELRAIDGLHITARKSIHLPFVDAVF